MNVGCSVMFRKTVFLAFASCETARFRSRWWDLQSSARVARPRDHVCTYFIQSLHTLYTVVLTDKSDTSMIDIGVQRKLPYLSCVVFVFAAENTGRRISTATAQQGDDKEPYDMSFCGSEQHLTCLVVTIKRTKRGEDTAAVGV